MNVPPSELSPYFQTRLSAPTASSAGPILLVPATPNRIAIYVSLIGGTPIFVWPDNTVSLTKGITVGGKVDSLLLLYRDLGAVVCGEWYVATAGLSLSVPVIETIFGQTIPPNLPPQ